MKLKNLVLVLALISFASCEKGTDVICKISNKSKEKITVKVYYKYLTSGITETTIASGETKDVFQAGRNVGGFHESTNINNVIDSVTATTETGKTLNRYYNSNNDWDKVSNRKKQTITFSAYVFDDNLQ